MLTLCPASHNASPAARPMSGSSSTSRTLSAPGPTARGTVDDFKETSAFTPSPRKFFKFPGGTRQERANPPFGRLSAVGNLGRDAVTRAEQRPAVGFVRARNCDVRWTSTLALQLHWW